MEFFLTARIKSSMNMDEALLMTILHAKTTNEDSHFPIPDILELQQDKPIFLSFVFQIIWQEHLTNEYYSQFSLFVNLDNVIINKEYLLI